jgi:hypothetical protein
VVDASRWATYEAVAAEAPLLQRDRVISRSAGSSAMKSRWHAMIAWASDVFVATGPDLPRDVTGLQYTS